MEETLAIDPRMLRVIIIMAIITLPLKAIAMWRAARAEQKGWYIAVLVLNTFGILELTYLFYFSKKPVTKTNQNK